MMLFFGILSENGAEFGYRVAHEATRFIHFYKMIGNYDDENQTWFSEAFDCLIAQKFLPKLHGSRAKLGPLLKKLWFLCVVKNGPQGEGSLIEIEVSTKSNDRSAEPSLPVPESAKYPISAEKIGRMWRLLNENGFTSFAEA
jgi:5-methylcytosine-specific restriction protein B